MQFSPKPPHWRTHLLLISDTRLEPAKPGPQPGPAHVPPAPELGTRWPPSDSLPFASSEQFQPHEALMNTHDSAKHTHAGPQWVTNTHEAHTRGSSGKLFPTELPHSLECESQRKPRPGVLLARAHKAPCGFPHAGTALASLGAEPPWYPRGPSTGPELCAGGSSHPGFQQVRHTFVELCRAMHLPSHTAQWDFFFMVELTSFFFLECDTRRNVLLESSSGFPSLLAIVSFWKLRGFQKLHWSF